MPTISIDNHTVTVPTGSTILTAAKILGIEIPTLCYREGHAPLTSCSVCVVRVNGSARLSPACATVAVDGMVVESNSDEVRLARRTALELLLSDHTGDCQAPCQRICPAHMDIPNMTHLIAAGRYREAIAVVKQHIALPATLGRICPEICEQGCRRKEWDHPVSVCRLKRFVAEKDLSSEQPYLPPCKPATGKSVAIVGAGPAGLAAAYTLAQEGHACTIFEATDLPGGGIRTHISEEILPHSLLDAEIALVLKLGPVLQTHTRIGVDISLADLQKQFDAVLITMGTISEESSIPEIERTGQGIKVDRQTLQTSLKGVFAAGSAVTPVQHAVRAIGAGRIAALSIAEHLCGTVVEGQPDFAIRSGKASIEEVGKLVRIVSPADRHDPDQAFDTIFSDDWAQQEAERCLRCECGQQNECKLRVYAAEYGASSSRFGASRRPIERITAHPQVIFEPGKCIACGICIQVTNEQGEPVGLTFQGRGFDVKVAVPLGQPLSSALTHAVEECARACPTGAIRLRRPLIHSELPPSDRKF